jgi:hypothetical protein
MSNENMGYNEDEKRLERRHRRKLIADWKAEAKAIRDADPGKRMLMREAKHVAQKRIEDSARTEAAFEDVNRLWDDIEIVESWRIAKHEELTLSKMEDYELPERDRVIPAPFGHVWWRNLLNGNFIDVIFDCPHELHELTTSRPVIEFVEELGEGQKEILYYWSIRQWTPQRIAAFREQTDRNIRKVYNNMIGDIRRKMYMRLFPRYRDGKPLTLEQREFCIKYWEQLDDVQRDRLTRKFEEEERRRRKAEKGAGGE